jgi:hypothetical protein
MIRSMVSVRVLVILPRIIGTQLMVDCSKAKVPVMMSLRKSTSLAKGVAWVENLVQGSMINPMRQGIEL